MARNVHVTQKPVTLEGFQAVLEPGKFGYSLAAVIDEDVIDKLEDERQELLKWCLTKVKNPKRSVLKPEPWEEVAKGKYKIKFSWNEKNRPPVVDTEGSPVTDTKTPLYGGSTVKIGFYHKPYVLRDDTTYGTTLKLVGIQVVSVKADAGVDAGDLEEADVADLFGKTKGFKTAEPNVIPASDSPQEDDEDVDF